MRREWTDQSDVDNIVRNAKSATEDVLIRRENWWTNTIRQVFLGASCDRFTAMNAVEIIDVLGHCRCDEAKLREANLSTR